NGRAHDNSLVGWQGRNCASLDRTGYPFVSSPVPGRKPLGISVGSRPLDLRPAARQQDALDQLYGCEHTSGVESERPVRGFPFGRTDVLDPVRWSRYTTSSHTA